MEGSTPSTKVLKRAGVVGAVLAALFVLLAMRILVLQLQHYDEYEQRVIDQMTQESTVSADRGEIYDRNGILLATNITTYRLLIDPAAIMRRSEADGVNYADIIAKGISEVSELDLTYDYVIKQSEYTKYRDRTLKRHVMEDTADVIRAFLKEKDLDDKGLVYLQATSKRYYPYGSLACHVLGFTSGDGDGLYGIEYQYNEYMKGEDGKYVTARDSFGNEMPYKYESYIPAVDGYNLTISIDVFIQAELEEQLKTAYIESGGQNRTCGIVTDVDTGEILAMAVYPSYDLNDPWTLNSNSEAELSASGYLPESDEYQKFKQALLLNTWSNKAVTESYIPGSTFKLITASMAYEENLVNENETFYCPGFHIVLGQKIKCHKLTGHGALTFARGIQQSCNPVLMIMGGKIGQDKFYNNIKNFGYLEKTGIDLPGEGGSIFASRANFTELDLAIYAFGQNFNVTPIQHINAISAVANGGNLMTPHIIKNVTDDKGNVIYSYEDSVKRQIVSENTSETVAAVLEEGVATDGGAKNAYVAGYRVAAKTGTSEKKERECPKCGYTGIPDGKEIPEGEDEEVQYYKCTMCSHRDIMKNFEPSEKYVCSTVAYAPADNPKIAAIILVDEPTKGVLYGSVVAAPYVGNLMEEILPYYGVEAVYTEAELEKQAITVPNYRFWSVRMATKYAEAAGFEIEFIGDYTEDTMIQAQSPAAGEKIERGSAKIIFYTQKVSDEEKLYVTVPQLEGTTAVAANGTLTNLGLNIKISGTKNYMSGTGAVVVEQTPPAGTLVEKGSVVNVTFRYLDDED